MSVGSGPNSDSHTESVIDETTPLIVTSSAGPSTQANAEPFIAAKLAESDRDSHDAHEDDDDDNKPLPKAQIFLLCYARMVEPIAVLSQQEKRQYLNTYTDWL